MQLISKLNPNITQGTRQKEDEFEFNKDAGMYVCKAGHMAIRKARHGKKNISENQRDTYYFDIEECKRCPFKEGCYKEGAKSKSYSVTIYSTEHSKQKNFKKVSCSKKNQKNAIKLKLKIVNSNIDTGMIWHLPRVSLACKCKEQWQYSLLT